MLSKVFTFFSGLMTGVFTGFVLVAASLCIAPESWKNMVAAHFPDEE